jgi:cyclohexanone monooxygenase
LVDIKDREPIVEITETGIRTTENDYEFDIIVLATGFQAYTGAQEALAIRGRNGLLLRDKWDTESASIMGVFVADFPNLFMITGPQAPFANLPTSIEQNIIYIVDCIKKMESEGYDLCEPSQQAEDEWTAHVAEIHQQTLMAQGDKVHSWMMGANLENRNPRVLIYYGGANVYYDKMRESVEGGFPEVAFEREAG